MEQRRLKLSERDCMDRERFDWILEWLDEDLLTLKEMEFIESCKKGFEKYGGLTPSMEEWLEAIYREKPK